jgi:heterodisulfide reductase subunit A
MCVAGPTSGKLLRPSDGREPRRIVFIQCVGSRDVNKYEYCSGFCCMLAIKNAVTLKEREKDAKINILYKDMRTNFKGYEELYQTARDLGIEFTRVELTNKKIAEDPETKNLTVYAETEHGDPVEVEADLVVLATAAIPNKGSDEVARIMNITQGTAGFFMESHPKHNPMETSVEGIFIAGACQGLKDIPYSVAQGSGAAARAATILSKPMWEIEPIVAIVNGDYCSGCGVCEDVCEYEAIKVEEEKEKLLANVIEGMCKGCGVCGSTCPSGAITMPQFTTNQILAQVRAALKEEKV